MGQGYSMATLSAASVSMDIPELSDLTQDKVLASARFTKSLRARSKQGLVFVKAVTKPNQSLDVRPYVKQLTIERNILARIPNTMGYQRIVETGPAGFLVRQFMYGSLYDRLSTRPFLEDIEKRWLSYQLLCAVRDCHAQNLYHGDIKTENVLVTSWNWLYLTDFSSCFKPTTLPEDNPADFSFFFDTSARRVCYVAPERFTSTINDNKPTQLNWAMDMFSVGCVIAELFLEGPIFTLSQIFKYRSAEYNPEHAHLAKIDDPEIRDMIINMVELDPEKRYSAEQHLSFYKAKIFPEYFYTFLHDYMEDLTEPNVPSGDIVLDSEILTESDRKIEQISQDFDKIAFFLGYTHQDATDFDARLSNGKPNKPNEQPHIENLQHDGTLLFLTLVSSALRNTAKTSARLKACDLLTLFAHRLPDEAKLDRILPYVVSLLNDPSDSVKVAALHATTSILSSIRVVSPINAYLFPEYIFPRLKNFVANDANPPSSLVRAAFASCLADLALASSRMLDMVQAIRADGRVPALSNDALGPDASFHGLYDVARAELVPKFEEATTNLISDSEISVRRALLGSISRLCLFFGSSKSSDVILSHLNTYLNEPDWMLKCAFYESLVGVATYVGTSSLEQFIVPIMLGSMTDAESFVVEKVIRSFSRMAALGLFQWSLCWDLVGLISRFLIHPSIWIREAAVQFIEQACRYLSDADRYCIVLPMLQPFLRSPLLDFSERSILEKLKSALSRPVFDAAVQWASKRSKSLFWTAANRDGIFNVGQADSTANVLQGGKRFSHRIPPSQKDKDDQQSLETLRNFGFSPDDEIKLMALREYILKYAHHKGVQDIDDTRLLNNIVSLAQLDITPQNVFFDTAQPYRPATRARSTSNINGAEQRTLADALLDASVNVQNSDREQNLQPSSQPIELASGRPILGERQDSDIRTGSFERQNTRLSNIKGEASSHRSSSVAGRHALLDTERLSSGSYDRKSSKTRAHSTAPPSRTETIKANAELSTTQENVFGKIDRTPTEGSARKGSALTQSLSVAENSRSKSPRSPASTLVPFEANHSYTGNEPAVLRLLDNHVTDTIAVDLMEFGTVSETANGTKAIQTAAGASQISPPPTASPASGNREPWRPSGRLMAQFVEHTAAVNRVVVAPDHSFFVTASDDGTCKIWDTSRLEKNVSARSRYTHKHADGAQVKALCFVENTFTFVSAATDGSIHAVKVEAGSGDGNEPPKLNKPILVRDWQIPEQKDVTLPPSKEASKDEIEKEHATWVHHYREPNSNSVLLVATTACRILMVDMKNMEIIRVLDNPLHHGIPTSFCVDRKHHWLLVGTSYGVLDLWDLRFKLRLRSFGIGGAGTGKRIDKLLLHPSRGHGKWVIVSCSGEISIWDIEKMTCREVLRPSSFQSPSKKIKNYEPWFPDDESSEAIIKRLATGNSSETPKSTTANQSQIQNVVESPHRMHGPSITSLHAFYDFVLNTNQPDTPSKSTLMLSVGEDRTIRYWNVGAVEKSFIVAGPMINLVGEENKTKARYETSWPTSISLSGLVQLVEEKLTEQIDEDTSTSSTPKKRGRQEKPEKRGKTPRNVVISAAQEHMLKTHMDDITDVTLLRKPYGCVVSVDKGGAVYVFY